MAAPRDALEAVGQMPDVEIDIAGTALQFARIDQPDADWRAAEAHISELARQTVELSRELSFSGLPARIAGLAGLLATRHDYHGDTDTYDDPANANLIQVIERRRGLPVALGILWLHCARSVGWGAHGVDFPGHFLIAFEQPSPNRRHRQATAAQVVVDVFAGGVPLGSDDLRNLLKQIAGPSVEMTPGVLQPMSARRVLLRLQENVRVRRLRHEDLRGALACTEDMLRIAPDNTQLWREAAAMHERLDHVAAAIKCYTRFLDLVPAGEAAARARAMIDDLRARLH